MQQSKIINLIILVVVCFLGILGGALFTGHMKDSEIQKLSDEHQKNLKKEIKLEKERLKIYDKIIASKDSLHQVDSLIIVRQANDIVEHDKLVQKQRREAAKLSRDEKKNFLINRYSPN